MDLTALADFHLVVTHGGFGKASRASGRPKATLSRRVMELEESVGVRLLERGARSLRLTPEGRALHERTAGLLSEIVEAGTALADGQEQPRGRLRVSAPVLFCQSHLGPIAAKFVRAYPEVELEIVAEDRKVDLVEEGYDVAIRVNPKPDDRLVGRLIARDEMLVVAPPDLPLPPASDADGAPSVAAVAAPGPANDRLWRFERDGEAFAVRPDARLRVTSLGMAREAARNGAGATVLPRSLLCEDMAKGFAVWGAMPEHGVELWALHASRRLTSAKVSAFVEALVAAFPDRRL